MILVRLVWGNPRLQNIPGQLFRSSESEPPKALISCSRIGQHLVGVLIGGVRSRKNAFPKPQPIRISAGLPPTEGCDW